MNVQGIMCKTAGKMVRGSRLAEQQPTRKNDKQDEGGSQNISRSSDNNGGGKACSGRASSYSSQRSGSVTSGSSTGQPACPGAELSSNSTDRMKRSCPARRHPESTSQSVPRDAGILQDNSADIPRALHHLGLSAQELFAGSGGSLPGFASEEKLTAFLQQLWTWAVQTGKVDAGAPVTVPRLVLVVQWGLQRMREGAVQGRDQWELQKRQRVSQQGHRQEHRASPPPAQQGSPQTERLPPLARDAHPSRSADVSPASLAAGSGKDSPSSDGTVHKDTAAQQTALAPRDHQPGTRQQEGGQDCKEHTAIEPQTLAQLPPPSVAARESPPRSTPKRCLGDRDGVAQAQGGRGGKVCRLLSARSSMHGSLLSSWLSALPGGLSGLAEGGAEASWQWTGSGTQQQQQEQQPWSVASVAGTRRTAVPRGPFSSTVLHRGGSSPFEGDRHADMSGFPPAATLPALHSAQVADFGSTSCADPYGVEAGRTGFTAALQEVLLALDAKLAARGALCEYSVRDLREACALLERQLDAHQKQWLAQAPDELLQVLLQACSLVQLVDSQVRSLQHRVSSTVARISHSVDAQGGREGQPRGFWPYTDPSPEAGSSPALPQRPARGPPGKEEEQRERGAPREGPGQAGGRQAVDVADEELGWDGGLGCAGVSYKRVARAPGLGADQEPDAAAVAQQLLDMMQSHLEQQYDC